MGERGRKGRGGEGRGGGTFNNNMTLLRNSTFDVTWTSGLTSSLPPSLTNKVLELVSKLVVHSSKIISVVVIVICKIKTKYFPVACANLATGRCCDIFRRYNVFFPVNLFYLAGMSAV